MQDEYHHQHHRLPKYIQNTQNKENTFIIVIGKYFVYNFN